MEGPAVTYNFLGKSGLKVSNLCLGAMTFGQHQGAALQRPTQADEELSYAIMDRFAELGGNFIDTANVYNYGHSEEIVGSWLQKQDRNKFVIATKVRMNMDPTGSNVNKVGLSRRHIVESCDESLKRLQTDYIDILQGHIWDSATPVEETLRTFDDLIRSGKIRYFGFSNVCGWQMQSIVDTTRELGLNKCISLQQHYCLLRRHSELEAFAVCRNHGIAVMPWSPLKGGLLTGKFKRGAALSQSSSRVGYMTKSEVQKHLRQSHPDWKKFTDDDAYWDLLDLLKTIGDKHGKSIAQVALRWLLQKEGVASVIIGATNVTQLEDNMGAGTGWELSREEMQTLDDATSGELDYPYDMITKSNLDRVNAYNA